MKPDETVVLVLTGNVLKDPDFTIDFHRGDMFEAGTEDTAVRALRHPPIVLDATLDAVTQTLERAEKSGS